MTSNDVHSDS